MDYDHLEDEIGIKKEAVLFKKGFFHITTCLSANIRNWTFGQYLKTKVKI